MNTNCEAHYHESSQCFEAGASALIGSTPDSPGSRTLLISSSVYDANKGTVWGGNLFNSFLFLEISTDHWAVLSEQASGTITKEELAL